MKTKSTIISGDLNKFSRKTKDDSIIKKNENGIEITYFDTDSLDDFESSLNSVCGNSSSFFKLRKKISTLFLSVISVIIILFALISSSLYEDMFKKILFETPFDLGFNDYISLFFVLIFFFGLLMMPSILEGESSQLKDGLQSWFNKDTRRLKRLQVALKELSRKTPVNIYNVDILEKNHWMNRLIIPTLLKNFDEVNFYVRNDLKKVLENRLKKLGVSEIVFENVKNGKFDSDIEFLLSSKEKNLYSLMHLSSTKFITNSKCQKTFISLELFEYCGRNFFDTKNDSNILISGFQNFINRSFDDFKFVKQEKSAQIYFSSIVKNKELDDEKRSLSYYLRNHIEECLDYFDNPISLLILYYYVKDIVLDEKRTIAILQKLILAIKNKQQYSLIDNYWFDIAGEMFNPQQIENFELTNNSIYRKLSIESLDDLKFLFERNGYFQQALLISQYLFEINPNKYAVDISSLYERMGDFNKAYETLPENIDKKTNNQIEEIEVKFLQRKSWIIVSKRDEEKKQEGLKLLEALKNLLYSHSNDNKPIWLWHYYNIKANYCEWNEDYEMAIENYKKCLAIPNLGDFEYGGTFINMSISYRFKFIFEDFKNIETIDKSIHMGDIGLLLKTSVGDRDEMPVVLHNQALNILYKSLVIEDKKCLEKVDKLTLEAIEILDSTNSIKRLGILLCENIIANILLRKPTVNLMVRLKKHINLVDTYEKNQIDCLIEKFVKKGKIQNINL
jgi:tetratricopeptide (TPR) repeat protein